MKETELYDPVKFWLEENEWDVYPEVTYFSKRVDIIGIRDDLSISVELKTSLNLEVMAQAIHWKRCVNYSYVAVPDLKKRQGWTPRKKSEGRWLAEDILTKEGIGLVTVCDDEVTVLIEANKNTPKNIGAEWEWKNIVTEWHKKWGVPGGSKPGGHITPYRITMIKIQEFLKENPEATVYDILANVETHYRGKHKSRMLQHALHEFESAWCSVIKKGVTNYYFIKKPLK